ncbi:DUF222 domain-containing protein, partial [Gordonia sp. ABSL11-1]|uniref:HNH endonuclease signature motif containing protein n=1 Tax=Gordonia sp. ABSL11-1 TaxID=3053924 RepID=UPI0025743047
DDLKREAGVATTATGSLLPIGDVIRLAADAQQYLAVFAEHTAVPLYLGRAKRLASEGQRLASFARPDGEVCSAPGCDQPATQVEMHHAALDFAEGGATDIVDLTPACPKHNRMVGHRVGQFTTGVYRDGPHTGRTWWRRNSSPDAPANPEQMNRRPDIAGLYDHHLEQTRARIHPPPQATADPPPQRPTLHLTETIPPPISAVEARLALLLVTGSH